MLLLLLRRDPWGAAAPCWPFRKRQKMLCGVCISPHSISVCNTAAKTLLPEWGRKGYNNSVVRIFRCMGGRVTHIGPQALATPGIRRNISVPLGSYITQSEQNRQALFSLSGPGPCPASLMEQDGGRISFIVGQLLELPKCGSGFCIYILKYVKGRSPISVPPIWFHSSKRPTPPGRSPICFSDE